MELSSSSLRPRDCYALLTSLVVPRPIAWVSTQDATGRTNLAPFSYFTGLGSDPPMITLGISQRRDGSDKDTVRIARETGVLCVNLVEEHDAERMNQSAAELPAGQSEIDAQGIATLPCAAIAGVRVASARAALECRLVEVHRYGRKVAVNLLVAEVLRFHVDDGLLSAPTPGAPPAASPELIRPLARLGDRFYARLGERLRMERP
ncbi:MAG: flavin reductase family protein [Deltaproteobacteria bacterium]|nr:flavin reductase family protein [Deltaproteobacteria bacterium]